MLEVHNVTFRYPNNVDDPSSGNDIFKNFSLNIYEGSFVALLGSNGSGKSTLGKLLNGLLIPDEGKILVDGFDTSNSDDLWEVRRRVGMVFQNPGNQIVAAVVEDDIAFGLENLGIPRDEIKIRVDRALKDMDIEHIRKSEPHYLSGGQKQRVALAGILCMEPRFIVLDEPTAMLDPQGRRSVLMLVKELQRRANLTIVYITHHMDEVMQADRVIVLDEGKIIEDTSNPRKLFSDVARLGTLGLCVPTLFSLMSRFGYATADNIKDVNDGKEIAKALIATLSKGKKFECKIDDKELLLDKLKDQKFGDSEDKKILISLRGVSYTYMESTPFEHRACNNIDLDVYRGECLGVIGATGSGKSTLLQLFNGLLRCQRGKIVSCGFEIPPRGGGNILSKVRAKIGFLFQFSDQQLFETTVYDDVAFGPKNLGLCGDKLEQCVWEALDSVKFPHDLVQRSPLALSGGERRRVALAGVLACEPECLVLDEPTIGLDPKATSELIELLKRLNKEKGLTIVIISHRYEEISLLADRLAVVKDGRLLKVDKTCKVLYDTDLLKNAHLEAPGLSEFFIELKKYGLAEDKWPISLSEAVETLANCDL